MPAQNTMYNIVSKVLKIQEQQTFHPKDRRVGSSLDDALEDRGHFKSFATAILLEQM